MALADLLIQFTIHDYVRTGLIEEVNRRLEMAGLKTRMDSRFQCHKPIQLLQFSGPADEQGRAKQILGKALSDLKKIADDYVASLECVSPSLIIPNQNPSRD